MVQPSGSGGGVATLSAGDITSIVTQLQTALGDDAVTRMVSSGMFAIDHRVRFRFKRKAFFAAVV
jgi:hypothetical protein